MQQSGRAKKAGTDDAVDMSDIEIELPVSSSVLRLASLVFDAMFSSGMEESNTKRIKVDFVSQDEFIEFYNLLLPSGRAKPLNRDNVYSILARSVHPRSLGQGSVDRRSVGQRSLGQNISRR